MLKQYTKNKHSLQRVIKNTGLFKKDGAKIKACGESGKNGKRSITEGN
jgi:hypothetical protein